MSIDDDVRVSENSSLLDLLLNLSHVSRRVCWIQLEDGSYMLSRLILETSYRLARKNIFKNVGCIESE